MDYKDMKVGQKVRCVYYGSLFLGKTATITGAPADEYGQITVKWDDGTNYDTRWSYSSNFEPIAKEFEDAVVAIKEKEKTKNNVCCVCGYQDEWIASKDCSPACRVCAPKISLASDLNPTPEKIKDEENRAPQGNGFPTKSRASDIADVKAAFTQLQDPIQYKVGDRIRIRIKNSKDIWATVLESRTTEHLLFLDEEFASKEHHSWATEDTVRKAAIKQLGLDSSKKRCFWWGDFTPGYSMGTPDIAVIHKGIPIPKPSVVRTDLKHGDRIQISIKGKDSRWATVIDHKSTYGTTIFLDEKYDQDGAHSWVTRETDRSNLIEQLGLDPEKENCIFWGDGDRAKVLKEDDVKVLHVVDSEKVVRELKVGDTVEYTATESIVGDSPPLTPNKTYRVRKLVPYDGSFKVFLDGFEDENAWWQPLRFKHIREQFEFRVGDIIRCEDAYPPLIKGASYRVSGFAKNETFPKESPVFVEGSHASWFAQRFQLSKPVGEAPIKYPVGDRIQVQYWGETGWGTILGTVFQGDIEMPIASMDANCSWAGGTALSYLSRGINFTDTIKKLGLNETTPKCWKILPEEVLQVVPKGSAEVDLCKNPTPIIREELQITTPTITAGGVGGTFQFTAGINSIPLTFKFDNSEWKIESAAPITINGKKDSPINQETIGVDYAKENISEQKKVIEQQQESQKEIQKGIFEKDIRREILWDGDLKELWLMGPSFPKEKSFGSIFKEDAVSAGYRVAANQLTKGVKAAILKFMEDRGADNNKVALIREILETEMGNALIAMLLGLSLTYIPAVNQDKRAQKLAGEFRIGSMTITGNALMDTIWQHIKSLPQPEKVRVNTTEVRVAEETEEETIEDEKSNSVGLD